MINEYPAAMFDVSISEDPFAVELRDLVTSTYKLVIPTHSGKSRQGL